MQREATELLRCVFLHPTFYPPKKSAATVMAAADYISML